MEFEFCKLEIYLLRATWRPFSRPCGRWTRAISAGTTAVSPIALSSASGAPWRHRPLSGQGG